MVEREDSLGDCQLDRPVDYPAARETYPLVRPESDEPAEIFHLEASQKNLAKLCLIAAMPRWASVTSAPSTRKRQPRSTQRLE